MSLIVSWVLFPLVLVAIGAGWGVLVERAGGARVDGVLVVPLGLAAVIVVASLLTAWSVTAPAAVPIVGVGALAGVIVEWPVRRRVARWPVLAALGALFVYAAPVLLSGSATFAGYVRLDDTATWLGITDHVMSHGRSLADLSPSTYSLLLAAYVANSYPLGGFMLLGVGHGLTGIDSAWIFQPYLACCGAAVGLGIYALAEPLVSSPRVRALVAFLAAQPALLYGYSLWGGIKELTAAFLLVLGAALVARVLVKRPETPRGLLGVAVVAAGLIVTLGAGAAAWVVPALLGVVVVWVWRARGAQLWRVGRDVGLLAVTTAVLALPMWVVLSSFLKGDSNLYSSGQSTSENLGNLIQPLSGWQLAGVWPVGDFRLRAPTVASALLIGLVVLTAAVAIWLTMRRRQFGIVVYVALALVGCVVFHLVGSTPWVIAKAFAISSPALLAAALVGGALLLGWRRPVGVIVLLAIGGGVAWSNALAYHDVLLAPRSRLAELQHIGGLLAGKGPTLIGDYEVYADRHFLRAGAPVEPAEYRSVTLPLRNGAVLTKSAWADLDSFAPTTLLPYRSIVISRSPAESRPPSLYSRVWRGRYYELWQRPARPTSRLLLHIPYGESNTLPYCGVAQNRPGVAAPLCSANPAARPPCRQIEHLAITAAHERADLVAYQRPESIVARGDQTRWPAPWLHDPASRTLWPNTPGTAVAQINVYGDQDYELWLGGSFSRGFEVSVDGRYVGRVKDELLNIGDYAPVADVYLTPGIHTFTLTYPHSDLTPGSGDNQQTSLAAISLQPLDRPGTRLLTVAPARARTLCGRSLDWIEIVAPGA
ncbi:MAG TPA: hypothetical protein VG053_11245 [Solirubrobacteraceae bacterium]|nr:hypothetical protein [Solirubrobacteraceae bacterium]